MTPGSYGSEDSNLLVNCWVIKENSTYKMWYTGVDGGSVYRIFYCESSDGISWGNFQLVITNGGVSGTGWDNSGAYAPHVIKEGSLYKMWYTGINGNRRIIYCESSNGISWGNFQQSVDVGNTIYDTTDSVEPCVIKIGSYYKMWYTGGVGGVTRIIYCEPSNGINWSNFQLAIDVGASGTGYDNNWVADPTVMDDADGFKLWYHSSGIPTGGTFYCESENGITFNNYYLTNSLSHPAVINENGIAKMWGVNAGYQICYCESF